MKRKAICLHYLIIGSILWIVCGCGTTQVERIVTHTYSYVNNSGKPIQMKIYNSHNDLIKDESISNGATLSFELIAEGGAGPFEFDTNTKAVGDSLYVNFANERYQTYRKGDYIFSYKGYKETKISEIKSHFTYEFTPDDFENAKMIGK